MNLPDANPEGYVTASVSNVSGFHHADFLLAHGSGDDNVHFANSAHLLDMFTREKVRGYRFRMFTDRCVSALHSAARGRSDAARGMQRPQYLQARREPGAVRVYDGVPARKVGQGREETIMVIVP